MAFRGILERSPSFGEMLASKLSQGLQKGVGQGTDFAMKMGLQKAKAGNGITADDLIEAGVSPEDAKLFSKFTTGGKTKLAADILEGRKRGIFTGNSSGNSNSNQEMESGLTPQKPQDSSVEEDIQSSLHDQDFGLTPAERVRRGAERFKTGFPIYKESGEKLRTFAHNKRNLDILDDLRKSNKLPKGLGRLNVDDQGNLKLPFLGSKESQRFVKTINEFASGAKDTYGSRVTNFDLAQYLKQFPNLLNSSEGIKDLIDHLRIVNDINSVYYKNLRSVYDKSGGVRKIDADVADSLAEKMSEKKVNKLTEKFKDVGMEDSLPPAHKNKGEQFQDEDTGEIYFSDGKSWIKKG